MPIIRQLLLVLLVWTPHSLAADHLSLQLSGSYTEFIGFVDYRAILSPGSFIPSDPDETPERPIANTRVPVAHDSSEVGWEATLAYRFWRNLHLLGGYVDLGDFASEPQFVGGVVVIAPPPVGTRPPGGSFPPIFGPGPIAQPLQPIRSQLELDSKAWLLGAKVEHAVTDRMNVYARAAALRASFHLDSSYPAFLEIQEPSDETGWAWGVGVDYEIFPRISAGVAFSQYDVKLQKLDSYQLTLAFDLL
jgi:hypothetical protein